MDDNCRKRYFRVLDVFKGQHKYIGICNQHISLLLSREQIKHKFKDCFEPRYTYQEIVESIINKYLFKTITEWRSSFHSNELYDKRICFTVCDRPLINTYVSVLDALEHVIKFRNHVIEEKLFAEIISYLQDNNIYKKYKTKYKECFAIINKIKRTYHEEREVLVNELFIKIYELNIKSYKL